MLIQINEVKLTPRWWRFWKRRILRPGKDYTIDSGVITFRHKNLEGEIVTIDYTVTKEG